MVGGLWLVGSIGTDGSGHRLCFCRGVMVMLIERRELTPERFEVLLARYDRVALAGVVKGGKTLLLDEVSPRRVVFHTDDLQARGLKWSEYPGVVMEELGGEDRFILAGMQVSRILRKGLAVDVVVWLNAPLGGLTAKQAGFSRGARTILHRWRREHQEVPVYFIGRAGRES